MDSNDAVPYDGSDDIWMESYDESSDDHSLDDFGIDPNTQYSGATDIEEPMDVDIDNNNEPMDLSIRNSEQFPLFGGATDIEEPMDVDIDNNEPMDLSIRNSEPYPQFGGATAIEEPMDVDIENLAPNENNNDENTTISNGMEFN